MNRRQLGFPISTGVVVLGLLAGGALPGEMRGCGTDLSDEVDHVVYCSDRCGLLCGYLIDCGLYVPPEDPPEGVTVEEVCQTDCERQYNCGNPQLCPNPDRYISELEAEECFDGLRSLGESECTRFCTLALWGVDDDGDGRADYCPTVSSCTGEELCDPPDWE
jgi:hypothetical protein